MTISSATVVEVRLGGSDTNGGGFVTGASGTDWSQQDTPQYSVTDAITAGSTIITSATAAFGTDVVGNLAYVQGGGGAVSSAWYQIISRTNATTIVVDRATGLTAGTSTTLKIGGALASPGQVPNVASVVGNTVFIKYYSSAAYVITSTANNVPAGCPTPAAGIIISGYDTTRATYTIQTNRPTVQLSTTITSSVNIFAGGNNDYFLQSVIIDGSSVTNARCGFMSGEYFYVKAMGGPAGGLAQNSGSGRAIYCEITGCSATPMSIPSVYFSVCHDNTLASPTNVGAFAAVANGQSWFNCISYNNNCDGFAANGNAVNCVAYGNGGAGFNAQNGSGSYVNCISEANSSAGYRVNTGRMSINNCADYNNGTRTVNASNGFITINTGVTGTNSFFTNAAGGVFTLNNTAGGGAGLRATGFPSVALVSTSNTDYADVGPIQSSNAGSGNTTIYGVMGA